MQFLARLLCLLLSISNPLADQPYIHINPRSLTNVLNLRWVFGQRRGLLFDQFGAVPIVYYRQNVKEERRDPEVSQSEAVQLFLFISVSAGLDKLDHWRIVDDLNDKESHPMCSGQQQRER